MALTLKQKLAIAAVVVPCVGGIVVAVITAAGNIYVARTKPDSPGKTPPIELEPKPPVVKPPCISIDGEWQVAEVNGNPITERNLE